MWGVGMTYRVGQIILAHNHLNRVSELVGYFVRNSCPVVLHIDLKSPGTEFDVLYNEYNEHPLVRFVERLDTYWGCFSLVEASLKCSETMIKEFPDVGHVLLNSGSCLPSRPVSSLVEFLSSHRGSDFIESVSIENEDWVQDGLSVERFKFYFVYSWKTQRLRFDFATWLQRRLKINRKCPDKIIPHLGSQWWCLTKRTLLEILNDPNKPRYDKFFSKTWIPDESYFQTLAREHSERLESRSLTWSKFDCSGKPFLLYDDHLKRITSSSYYMARKVWPNADLLYSELLQDDADHPGAANEKHTGINDFFEEARALQKPSRKGKVNPGRFPTGGFAREDKTARQYTVIMGGRFLFPDIQSWLNEKPDLLCHGNLFAKERVEFAGNATFFKGNISDNRLIRNYRAPAFLANTIWNHRDTNQAFLFDLGDNQKGHDAIFKDPNAQVVLIKEAWILHFIALQRTGDDTRSKAKLLYGAEQRLKRVIARESTKANILAFHLDDIIKDPSTYLQAINETIYDKPVTLVSTPTQNLNIEQLNDAIRYLRNSGFKLDTNYISLKVGTPKAEASMPRLIK